jgi:hypothetical protein
MTTRSIGPFRAVKDKEGKIRVVKRASRMPAGQAKNKHQQAAREEKAWKLKSERFTAELRLKAMRDELAAKARGKG